MNKIEMPHRFRLATAVANAVTYDLALRRFPMPKDRARIRAYGHIILSMGERRPDECGMVRFTIRFESGETVDVFMKNHKGARPYPTAKGNFFERGMEDWWIHSAEARYWDCAVRLECERLVNGKEIFEPYDHEDLYRIKESPYGWYHGNVIYHDSGSPLVLTKR